MRAISVEQWLTLTREGIDLPIHIPLYGHSMHPLIRRQKDIVTVRSLKRPLKKGDIVLFLRADGHYVVHRVHLLREDGVQTLGDHCSAPDAPIAASDVLGIVTHIRRGKLTFCVDTPVWRAAGRLWSAALPLRLRLQKWLHPVKQTVKNMLRR